MDIRRKRRAGRRRGVVLILILGMLGLLALIGVTFATFSGQAQMAARDAAQSVVAIPADAVFDFGLTQLINDTDNPASPLKGHSLKRDMFGNDARNNYHLAALPEPLGQPLYVTGTNQVPSGVNDRKSYIVTTNIPTGSNSLIQQVPQLYNANFAGCVLKLQQWLCYNDQNFTPYTAIRRPDRLTQTFEVIYDDTSGTYHALTLTLADLGSTATNLDGTDSGNQAFVQPDSGTPTGLTIPSGTVVKNLFEIDGRYMRAFNGSGLNHPNLYTIDNYNFSRPYAAYPNFLYNSLDITSPPNSANTHTLIGLNDPNGINSTTSFYHMDEDYDAPDNENWFLALKSADSSVILPSFHRPGNIIYNPTNLAQNDWADTSFSARAKFLRPRKIDHPMSGETFPDLVPDLTTGKITYDVDNDGDGVTDSVWLDLGYPVQRDSNGKLFKPLFAFMVLGLNGRLPLNTAGNLNKRNPVDFTDVNAIVYPAGSIPRDFSGTPTPGHASHIGYSTNEINPEYALTPAYPVFNEAFLADNTLPPTRVTTGPTDGALHLQFVLQGNPGRPNPPSGVTPVPSTEGRFGEVDLIQASSGTQFPRAGRSYVPNNLTIRLDGFDTNFDGLDFYPSYTGTTNPETPLGTAVTADLLDAVSRQVLPSERYRSFVTPIDLTGNGRVIGFDGTLTDAGDYGTGADGFGRFSYLLHYRPPGVAVWPSYNVDITDVPANRVNVLHGYEAARNQVGGNARVMAPMPWDISATAVPTFSNAILSNLNPDPTLTGGMLPDGSLALNEASQLDLYKKTPYDAPYGPADQEWLNRYGDVDQSGLHSRLSTVAEGRNLQDYVGNATQQTVYGGYPNLFTDPANGSVKRNLFSVESWDVGTWAAPTFSLLNVFGVPLNNTAQKMPGTGAMPSLMHGGKRINLNLPLPPSNESTEATRQKWCRDAYQMFKYVLYPPYYNSSNVLIFPEQQATAEQLAAIGQYVVNIVDFRDPDATMTRFDNYDLEVEPTPTLIDVTAGDPSLPSPTGTTGPFQSTGHKVIPYPAGVRKATANPNPNPLPQWGMEYNPVAITEVLAYQFLRRDTVNNMDKITPRLFVELVSTLTNAKDNTAAGVNPSELDLNGWGFIITQDNPDVPQTGIEATISAQSSIERPNRVTGQLSQNTIDTYFVPLALDPSSTATMGLNAIPAPLTNRLKPINGPGATDTDPYVMANAAPNAADKAEGSTNNTDSKIPNSDATIAQDLIDQIPATKLATLPQTQRSDYYWLHLLRPANPEAADMAAEPKVVVDSFRFPYFVDNGKYTKDYPQAGDATVKTSDQAVTPMYSTRRYQPYRGGHFVPRSDAFPNTPNPYGFTEQSRPARESTDNDNRIYGLYLQKLNGSYSTPAKITAPIYHSIGQKIKTSDPNENWDALVFHDRDFQSVAELMMVPACPPGLFTKQFVELPNPQPNGQTGGKFVGDLPPYASYPQYDYTASPPTRINPPLLVRYYYSPPFAKTPMISKDPTDSGSHDIPEVDLNKKPPSDEQYSFTGNGVTKMPNTFVFPYLAEAFFNSTGTKNGWYKALEFFEVPSAAQGYIGPVAAGQNADWARQDLRPGLLNLNLIVDEEVFFGLLDDPRLNMNPAGATLANLPPPTTTPTANVGIIGTPQYATAVYPNGMPSYAVPLQNRGYPILGNAVMKASFSDFLKLRDGGSGMVLSPFSTSPYAAIWGSPTNLIALPSRPFRSLANQSAGAGLDIHDTVLRPARLPAAQNYSVAPVPNFSPGGQIVVASHPTPWIPQRRLFQIPDYDPSAPPSTDPPSPSAEDVPPVIAYDPDDPTQTKTLWQPGDHPFLSNTNASLFVNTNTLSVPNVTDGYLGAKSSSGADHRSHPYYRTEMLSKVMNQTTVRTHQYAVWMTVGFFEVVKPGNPQLAGSYDNNGLSMAIDQLGKEIGAETGKNVRYRSYYLIDRTKATGFDPYEPGDFRDLITFRRRIE